MGVFQNLKQIVELGIFHKIDQSSLTHLLFWWIANFYSDP